MVNGICDPSESRARHHHSLKLGSKSKYLNDVTIFSQKILYGIYTHVTTLFLNDKELASEAMNKLDEFLKDSGL